MSSNFYEHSIPKYPKSHWQIYSKYNPLPLQFELSWIQDGKIEWIEY